MDRPANDITTEARVVSEVYLIDPTTKKPYAAGGGGGGSISAEATAAPPSYEEGASAPLSMDLDGNLRIGGVISAETATTATAAAPTYIEASADNPLSVNLSGDLRTVTKQSGSWTVAATQSGTWNVTNISGTISLPTGAATLAGQTAVTGTKAAGTAATSSILTGGVFNTSLPTLTNGQQAAAQMDASGRIYVNVGVAALPSGAATETTLGAVKTATEAVQAAVESTDPAPTDEVGNTPFADNAVDESAGATTVLSAPGKLVWLHVYNPHATDVVWLHIFDETTVVLGTTEPVLRIPWKAGSAGWQTLNLDCGLGIKISAHPTYAKSSTAPAADLVVNLGHKAA